jgi:hypothetical protein
VRSSASGKRRCSPTQRLRKGDTKLGTAPFRSAWIRGRNCGSAPFFLESLKSREHWVEVRRHFGGWHGPSDYQRSRTQHRCRTRHAAVVGHSRKYRHDRHEIRLRDRAMRRTSMASQRAHARFQSARQRANKLRRSRALHRTGSSIQCRRPGSTTTCHSAAIAKAA